MGLLYEVLRSAWAMPGVLLSLTYWTLRADWGMTNADIGGTIALGASCAAIVAFPAVIPREQQSAVLLTFFCKWIDRPIIWLFQQRWFMVVRKSLLLGTAALSVALLVMTPTTRSQDPFSLPLLVDKNRTDIAALKESVQEIRADVKSLRSDWDDLFWWLKGIGIATLTTLAGLNVTRLYTDAQRGKIEREREISRSTKPKE